VSLTRPDIEDKAREMVAENPQLRWGQAVFNACHALAPDAANERRGTTCDPFYADSRLARWWECLESDGTIAAREVAGREGS
jgi:hypothetical protein